MKKYALFLCCIAANISLLAQKNAPLKPFIIQGKIINSPEKTLKIFFEDENDQLLIDTIHLKDDGSFYLKTYKLHKPQRTSIQQNRTQLNNIFVAPGFNLTITGDASDFPTLFKGKKITGVGAAVNLYRIKMDSVYTAHRDPTPWFELKEEALLRYIKNTKYREDSVAKIVFNQKDKSDPYFETFRKMIQFDNESIAMYTLLEHITMNNYGAEKSAALLKANAPKTLLDQVSRDEYLISSDYKTWVLNSYITYVRKMDKYRDSTLSKQKNYNFNSIDKTFTGKVKDLFLYNAASGTLERSKSLELLNDAKKRIEPYIAALQNPIYKKRLQETFSNKEQQLMLVQTGKPAPKFILESNTGKRYSLSDFAGKVVYMDLWASWCVPCRQETPGFRALHEKYKNNEQVALIGVAVFDGMKEWKKALEEDHPEWLQLYDQDGVVARSYVASAIPKYILIDKKGNIINFNAPLPSDAKAIEKLINEELAK